MQKTKQIQVPRKTRFGKVRHVALNTRKTQRNSSCPCGSGKKFKKCCLK